MFKSKEEALKAWDEEEANGVEDTKYTKENLIERLKDEELTVNIKSENDKQIGVVVSLPKNKGLTFLFVTSILDSMALADDTTFEAVLAEVLRVKSQGLGKDPIAMK